MPIVALLNGLGYVVIARLDKDLAANQATWTAVGVGAFVATLVVVRRAADLERYRYLLALGGIGLLLAPLVPGIGTTKNGARLWLELGPFSFQPGELAKIALAIFFASYLVERRELLAPGGLPGSRRVAARARAIGPLLGAWALSIIVMVAEKDLGSLRAVLRVVRRDAVGRGRRLPVARSSASACSPPVRCSRGRRSATCKNACASGSTRGRRPAAKASSSCRRRSRSRPAESSAPVLPAARRRRSPRSATDLIFAAIGEELGLVGAAAVIAAFALIVVIGLRIAQRAERPFEQLLAAGLTTIIGVQSFLIIGGVTRLLPLTGITLPFVSYGGSSIIANWILIALLLRIS